MTNQAKPTLAASYADLLHVLNELVERAVHAAGCGFTDDEMSWLEEGQRAIANARALASTELADEIAISRHIDDVREIRSILPTNNAAKFRNGGAPSRCKRWHQLGGSRHSRRRPLSE